MVAILSHPLTAPPQRVSARPRPQVQNSALPRRPMNLHLPTLMTVCIAALATSAAVMTLHGLTQRTYRGYGWWVAAQWLLALGCVLHLMRDSAPELLPLGNLLLLQW